MDGLAPVARAARNSARWRPCAAWPWCWPYLWAVRALALVLRMPPRARGRCRPPRTPGRSAAPSQLRCCQPARTPGDRPAAGAAGHRARGASSAAALCGSSAPAPVQARCVRGAAPCDLGVAQRGGRVLGTPPGVASAPGTPRAPQAHDGAHDHACAGMSTSAPPIVTARPSRCGLFTSFNSTPAPGARSRTRLASSGRGAHALA